MKIGILQTGQAPDEMRASPGDYPELFARLLNGHGLDFQTWLVEDLDFPASVHDADGWLVTGSRHGAYEDHDFIPLLETFIRDAQAAPVPMVGICFGHQIMAQALGGKVGKFPGGWIVGTKDYMIDGAPVRLNAWHQDQVLELPEGAQVLGHGDGCAYAALGYDDWGYSVQPHPEFSDDFIEGLLDKRAPGVVPAALIDAARGSLGGPLDREQLAQRIARFFLNNRKSAAA